jgi:hypothetical protein
MIHAKATYGLPNAEELGTKVRLAAGEFELGLKGGEDAVAQNLGLGGSIGLAAGDGGAAQVFNGLVEW